MDSGRARPPIFLFTDFGRYGPYVGQMKAAIHGIAPALAVIDLCHDVAPFQAARPPIRWLRFCPNCPRGLALLPWSIRAWVRRGAVCCSKRMESA
jgi:hypothetical protein